MKLPQGEAVKEAVDGFDRLGFPQAVGAIDGSHIPIVRPNENATDFYNRKCFHSILLQGVVDHGGIFIDIYVGWPGRVHDARVFNNSSIFQKGLNGELFPNLPKQFGSVQVPLLLLGDPAYPLLPRLMKPFIQHGDFTPKQKKINHCLSRARIVIENAFG